MGFFGNEQVSKGATEFYDALKDTNQTLGDISVTVSGYIYRIQDVSISQCITLCGSILQLF